MRINNRAKVPNSLIEKVIAFCGLNNIDDWTLNIVDSYSTFFRAIINKNDNIHEKENEFAFDGQIRPQRKIILIYVASEDSGKYPSLMHENRSSKVYNSEEALVFILAHELYHVSTTDQFLKVDEKKKRFLKKEDEKKANSFAYNILRGWRKRLRGD